MDSPRTPGSFLPLPDAELEILIALADGEAHGYAIMRAVAERTEGRRRLGPGTLYTALKRLLAARLIEEVGASRDAGGEEARRRLYRLSHFGSRVLEAELDRLSTLVRHGRKRLQTPAFGGAVVRQASPAALRLSVWAYAHLLRAYPASFRAEFGGEMALLFSDCCRDEWRSAGPAGVCRLLARVALDTLVSAPPLWAERLEETMKGHSADRRWGFWLADHGLAMGGLALLAVGAATSWWAMSLGWAALAIAFFAWVAEADGLLALPRLGRVAIRTGGLEHTLRLQASGAGSGCSSSSARRTPSEETGRTCTRCSTGRRAPTASSLAPSLPPTNPSGWSLRGRVPVDDLRFEHHERSTYVTRGSLERSLSAAGV